MGKIMPRVFIGSSTKGIKIAQAIQKELQHDALCRIWSQSVFKLSKPLLQSLSNQLRKNEFAILVLTPDDLAIFRENEVHLPRDNVLFEWGLFAGHLGSERVFAVCCNDGKTKLPTDLLGIKIAEFVKPDDREISLYSIEELRLIIGSACTDIREAMEEVQINVSVHYIAPSLAHQVSRIMTIMPACIPG